MKRRFRPTSIYYVITCNQTQEFKDCSTIQECEQWAERVRHTFGDQKMTFKITRIREDETKL